MNSHSVYPQQQRSELPGEERQAARHALERKRNVLEARAAQIGKNLRKQKQTFIQWMGSGAYHYSLMFLGIWKPDKRMGTIADITGLQDEQERIMTKMAYKADCQRNLAHCKPTPLADEKLGLRYFGCGVCRFYILFTTAVGLYPTSGDHRIKTPCTPIQSA